MDRAGLEARFEAAKRIAHKAALFLLSHEDLRSEISEKAVTDYVTSADKECERLIIDEISSEFPDDGIHGEESGDSSHGMERKWIIDPIDGTVDFMASFPDYTISIAFQDEDGLALGVVMVPRQNEEFSALRGGGAFLNGKPIHTDEKTPLGETLAILVPPHRHHSLLHAYMERMERFYSFVSDMRSLGSAAISLCYVASGRCSVYYEIGLHIYDIAAGAVILTEAGGCLSLVEKEGDWIEVAASSRKAHGKLLETING